MNQNLTAAVNRFLRNRKNIIAGFMCLVLLAATVLPIRVEAEESAMIDITGVKVTDSGNWGSPDYVPENTIDRDYNSRWAGHGKIDGTDSSYMLAYEFPEAVTIAEIKMFEQSGGNGNRIKEVVVSTSEDGGNWTEQQTFGELQNNGSDIEIFTLIEPVNTKYVKLVMNTSNEPNVCEVEFYSESQLKPVENVKIDTAGAEVSDSGNYGSPTYIPENTIDGDYDSRWAANGTITGTNSSYMLSYKFPETVEIVEIKLYELATNDGNRIREVAVSTSEDGENWMEQQTFKNLQDNGSDIEVFTLDKPVNTKYVKLVIEASGEPNVCEVEFYSKGRREEAENVVLKYYDITKTSVKLYLPDMTGVQGYDVYQADAALGLGLEDMTKINSELVTDSEYQVAGLEPGAEYRFMIQAELENGKTAESNQVNVPTAKELSGTGLGSGEGANLNLPYSSLALNMEYKGPTLSDEKWFNWCVSPIKVDGKYHLFTSRWPDEMGNWGVKGQIVHSVADKPEGPYEFREVILSDPELLDTVEESQRDAVISDLPGHAPHNCRIKKVGDQYALTFILQTNDGQKIALLVSDSVDGPWRWAGGEKGFVVEASKEPGHWTYRSVLGTDNHDIIKIGDEYRIYFKAGPGQNATMHYGYAYSDKLEGPYTLCDEPALTENKDYIEDATVFEWNDAIYLLTTDNQGTNTGVAGYGILWKSNDGGKTFKYSDAKIGFGLMKDYIKWPVTGAVDVYFGWYAKFERPAILMGDDGNPEYFFGSMGTNLDGNNTSMNVMLKINWEPSSQTDIVSIAETSLGDLTGDGTLKNPLTGSIQVSAAEVSVDSIVSSGEQKELYSDSRFTEKFQNDAAQIEVGEETHLYIKITAEDGREAYYDIVAEGLPRPLPWNLESISDSGNYGSGYSPENTIDGDQSTRWAAQRPSDDYTGDFDITYTFDEETEFNRIKVYELVSSNDGNRVTAIKVETSSDGDSWDTVQEFTGLKDNGQDTETLDLDTTVSTKYLRLVFSTYPRQEDGNRQAEPNITEVELYNIQSESVVSVTGIELSQDKLNMKPGEQATLQAVVLPENATDKTVTWSSSDPDVVTVENGVVTALNEGTATITAAIADGKYMADCDIVVKKEETTDPDEPQTPTDPDEPQKPTDPDNPQTPTDPDEPQKPTDPDEPQTPTNPDNPQTPTKPGNVNTAGTDTTGNNGSGTTASNVNKVVKTGDEQNIWLPIAGILVAFAGISIVVYRKRNSYKSAR